MVKRKKDNDLQNTKPEVKDRTTPTPHKSGVNSGAEER
jgi:hypothetical protein